MYQSVPYHIQFSPTVTFTSPRKGQTFLCPFYIIYTCVYIYIVFEDNFFFLSIEVLTTVNRDTNLRIKVKFSKI